MFRDPTLNRLVDLASEQNLPVQVAGLRILEARAQLGIAIGNMFPQQQEGSGAATWNNISNRAANQATLRARVRAIITIGFDATWEIDFWGRYRRNIEAADATMLGTIADYDNALVSLTADVARTYATIRTFEVLLEIARENVKLQREGLQTRGGALPQRRDFGTRRRPAEGVVGETLSHPSPNCRQGCSARRTP